MTSVVDPGTGMLDLVERGAGGGIGSSITTCTSAFMAAWFSSVMAPSIESLVAAVTLIEIFSLASPPFCFSWMAAHTLSAAALLAGEQLAWERTNSQSPKERVRGSLSLTACTARSHGVGAGVISSARFGGGAVWPAAVAANASQSSTLPWYFLYLYFTYLEMLSAAAALPLARFRDLAPYHRPLRSMGFSSRRAMVS